MLRMITFLSLLIGITWIFGTILVFVDSLLLQYLFAFFNTFHGCVIFYFNTASSPQLRGILKDFYSAVSGRVISGYSFRNEGFRSTTSHAPKTSSPRSVHELPSSSQSSEHCTEKFDMCLPVIHNSGLYRGSSISTLSPGDNFETDSIQTVESTDTFMSANMCQPRGSLVRSSRFAVSIESIDECGTLCSPQHHIRTISRSSRSNGGPHDFFIGFSEDLAGKDGATQQRVSLHPFSLGSNTDLLSPVGSCGRHMSVNSQEMIFGGPSSALSSLSSTCALSSPPGDSSFLSDVILDCTDDEGDDDVMEDAGEEEVCGYSRSHDWPSYHQ
eukprot:scpid93940/ scgid30463/ 